MAPNPPADPFPSRHDAAASRCRSFDVPHGPIRPPNVPAEDLRRYGLPTRPGATAPPLLHRAWNAAFDREIALVRSVPPGGAHGDPRHRPARITGRRRRCHVVANNASETSTNWAGAYVTANRDRRFAQVWGAWTVPKHLAVPRRAGPPGVPFLCSHWIGLDGQRRYLDSSLPQVGTAAQLDADATTQAWAWVQWWARDAAGNAPIPLPLPLSPGDRVMAVLTAVDARSVVAVLVNLSRTVPIAVAVQVSAPPVEVGGRPAVPKITGATAEWILERPSIPGSAQQFDFPDYDTSTFDLCVAVESDGPQGLATGLPQDLHGARLIRMMEIEADAPSRVSILSLPHRTGATSLMVDYGGFRAP